MSRLVRLVQDCTYARPVSQEMQMMHDLNTYTHCSEGLQWYPFEVQQRQAFIRSMRPHQTSGTGLRSATDLFCGGDGRSEVGHDDCAVEVQGAHGHGRLQAPAIPQVQVPVIRLQDGQGAGSLSSLCSGCCRAAPVGRATACRVDACMHRRAILNNIREQHTSGHCMSVSQGAL